jgi:thiamine-monophosphate kinase
VSSSKSGELTRVAALRKRFARDAAGVCVGIGDDAAVLALAGGATVWTVDAQVEGTHFRTSWASWEDIGWRSFMAAASDLAAMGAEPSFALSALVLAPSVDDEALDALARGQAAAADAISAPIVGGNLARGTETSITTTLLGHAQTPIVRSAAKTGDGIWLAGPVGLAGAGLAAVEGKVQDAHMQNAHVAACLKALRKPVARIEEGRALSGVAHAAIDVSDGLAHDAWQLAEASNVSLVLEASAILWAAGDDLALAAPLLGRDALDLALHGGEDYALLATSPSPLPGFVRIGTVMDAGESRLVLTTTDGTRPLAPRGFDHFA